MRSCYRVAEFSQGWRGYLASHEVYFYCLEALPMLPCFVSLPSLSLHKLAVAYVLMGGVGYIQHLPSGEIPAPGAKRQSGVFYRRGTREIRQGSIVPLFFTST